MLGFVNVVKEAFYAHQDCICLFKKISNLKKYYNNLKWLILMYIKIRAYID